MRLPWIQLSSDGVRRAKMAGVLMGIGEHAGVGFVAALWMTALELAPDGDFSGNVEDASVLVSGAGGIPTGCASDAGGVVSILQRVGLVATVPKLRVRGLDRYRSAWLKNSKSRGRPPETEAEPKRKIKTEKKTETEKEEKLAGKKPPADPRLGPLQSRLIDAYAQERGAPYKHGGAKDILALKALLPVATDAEIADRWRVGLRASGWASCSTFAQLGSKWNDLAAPAAPVKGSVIHNQQAWGPDDDFLTGIGGTR